MIITFVLNLADTSSEKILVDGAYYVVCITDNSYFTAADIVAFLPIVTTSLTNLRTALEAPYSETKTGNIKLARNVVDRNLNGLTGKLEFVINGPEIPDNQRLLMAESTGIAVKNHVSPQRHHFKVDNTKVSGTVHIMAEGNAVAHQWQYTLDTLNFTGKVDVESTSRADTDIENLTKAKEYAFFHKPIIRKTITTWEGPIFLVIT